MSLHPPLTASGIDTAHLLLSYPLSPRWLLTLFRGATYQQGLEELVQRTDARVLVVYGDEDEFTGESAYRAWAEALERTGRVRCVRIGGGTHLWRGADLLEAVAAVEGFVDAPQCGQR